MDAAHSYAQRGWRVIQLHAVGPDGLTCSCREGRKCRSKGKHPLDEQWEKSPALSGPDIEAAWERRSRANVGLATGSPSGFWVLDIDPDNGGLESWERLKTEKGAAAPRTYAVQTGSGGWHFYFAMPDFALGNRRGSLGERDSDGHPLYPGIDVRGTGGQVVAPPSTTDKGPYRAFPHDITDAPDWLLDMIRPMEPTAVVGGSTDTRLWDAADESTRARWERYADAALQSLTGRLDDMQQAAVADGVGYFGEPWDQTTFEVACSLIEIANSAWNLITRETARSLLFEHAPTDDGFTRGDVQIKWDSAVSTVGTKARPAPESAPTSWMDEPNPDVEVDPRLLKILDPTRPDDPDDPPPTTGHGPARFFTEKGALLTQTLAAGILEKGPLTWGADGGFWVYEHGVWKPDHKVARRRAFSLLGNKARRSHASEAAEYLEHAVGRLWCDPIPEWINFRNGLLDWTSGTLHPHTPDVLSTVQMGADWDPDAACPLFDAFLDEILVPDYQQIAWEMIGYLMYSGNPLQVAFLLYGSGGNGKGTLLRVIHALLGEENVSSESLDNLNKGRFNVANLFGKIANMAGDIDGTYQESTANFKKLTGEDVLAGEKKYKDSFSFTNWAVPIFSANKIPGSADVTEGYLRRWVMLSFHRKFVGDERENSLSDRFMNEMSGIAAKAVIALRTLLERGHFEFLGDAATGREEFARTIDQVRRWVADDTIVALEHATDRPTLLLAYQAWAAGNAYRPLGSGEFYHRLESLGFKPADVGGMPGFAGLMAFSPEQRAQQQRAVSLDDEQETANDDMWRN